MKILVYSYRPDVDPFELDIDCSIWEKCYHNNDSKPKQEYEFEDPKLVEALYKYVYFSGKRRVPQIEQLLSLNARFACYYAINIIKDRWPEAEKTIAEDKEWFKYYATYAMRMSVRKARKIIGK